MKRVRSSNTTLELKVRRTAYRLGYRFRLYPKDLAGSPDLAFLGRKTVVFVHGCFWHGHDCARGARKPVANADYWSEKIAKNTARDGVVVAALEADGWKVGIIWGCESKEPRLSETLTALLGPVRRKDGQQHPKSPTGQHEYGRRHLGLFGGNRRPCG